MFLWRLIVWLVNADYEAWRVWRDLKHWRFNVALWGGAILALCILASGPNSLAHRVAAGIVFAACLIWGWIWDDRGISG
jgi:hypothetical protein